MGFIGTSFPKLESSLRSFSVELFAELLKPAWIDDILRRYRRQSIRIRKLPAPLVVWLSVTLGLFRTLSIPGVLARLGTILGVGSLWDGAIAPASTTIAQARDRIGFGPIRALFERLRDHLLEAHREQTQKDRVRSRHALQKEVARLKSKPESPGRTKRMRLLQKQIKSLSG